LRLAASLNTAPFRIAQARSQRDASNLKQRARLSRHSVREAHWLVIQQVGAALNSKALSSHSRRPIAEQMPFVVFGSATDPRATLSLSSTPM
jgi:hypothetical protein